MIYNPSKNAYFDLIDGQLLAKKMTQEANNQTQSVFKDLYNVELEKTTLVVKEVTNSSWSEETKATGTFYLEQKGRDKKGLALTKKDFAQLKPIFQEISEK